MGRIFWTEWAPYSSTFDTDTKLEEGDALIGWLGEIRRIMFGFRLRKTWWAKGHNQKKLFFKAEFAESIEQGSYTSQFMSKHVHKMFIHHSSWASMCTKCLIVGLICEARGKMISVGEVN